MRHPAVDDPGRADARADRPQAPLHLREHAARQVREQRVQFTGRQAGDDLGAAGPVRVEPLDVGEDHEPVRAEGHGERGGREVGVDVVDLPVRAPRDGRDDGDAARLQEGPHGGGLHGHDLADEADVHGPAVHPRGRRTAVMVCASSPDRPTAKGPWALRAPTSSRCTCPVSTIRTTSMVSGVVTRRPASKRTSRSRRSSMALICGPPPCTTTGRSPACHSSTTSCAKVRCSAGSTMALPPNLTTTVRPRSSSAQGRSAAAVTASAAEAAVAAEVAAVAAVVVPAGASPGRAWGASPSVSSRARS